MRSRVLTLITLATMIVSISAPTDAARRSYEKAEAKSVAFKCRHFQILNEREHCLRAKLAESDYSPADISLLWENLMDQKTKYR